MNGLAKKVSSGALPLPVAKEGSSGVRKKVVMAEESVEVPPAADSTPTPIFTLGYRELHARFLLLSSRFNSHVLVYSKHPLKIDLKKSRLCKDLSEECTRIAERIAEWPNRTSAGLAGEKSWVAERYLEIMSEAVGLMEGEERIHDFGYNHDSGDW